MNASWFSSGHAPNEILLLLPGNFRMLIGRDLVQSCDRQQHILYKQLN